MKNTFCAFSLEILLLYFLLMLTFWFCIVLFTLYIIVCVYVFNKDLNKLNVLVSLCYCCIKVLLKYYSSFTILFGWGKKPKLFFSLKVWQEKEPWCGFSWTRSAPAHPDTQLLESILDLPHSIEVSIKFLPFSPLTKTLQLQTSTML